MKQPHEMTEREMDFELAKLDFGKDFERDYSVRDRVLAARLKYSRDWGLTMPLAIKNNLIIKPMNNPLYPNFYEVRENNANGVYRTHESPLRAICEVLVAIAMEKAK